MGIFGNTPSPFEQDIEKITNEKNTSEDWGLIMDLCDRVGAHRDGPKDCLRVIVKRLHNPNPHVALQAITLLDACVNNCGKKFRLEVASREFEQEFKKLLSKSHPRVAERLKAMLKKWSEGDFKGDPQLNLIPSIYSALKRDGVDFDTSDHQQAKSRPVSKDPNVVSSEQEEEDIAKAIQMSLQETKASAQTKAQAAQGGGGAGGGAKQQLYPTNILVGNGAAKTPEDEFKEPMKARALYDFEAVEDNELTFKAGEIVIIIDNSDANWWKGSNHRGEGLFPANFVTTDLEAPSGKEEKQQRRRSVQFSDSVEVIKTQGEETGAGRSAAEATALGPVAIDESKIDSVLNMLHDADPTTSEMDPPELVSSENHVNAMGPLIDQELECVDRRLAQLTRLSTELVDALNLYHQLMRDTAMASHMMAGPPMPNQYGGVVAAAAAGGGNAGAPQHYMMQQPPPTMTGYMPPPPPHQQAMQQHHQSLPTSSDAAAAGVVAQPPPATGVTDPYSYSSGAPQPIYSSPMTNMGSNTMPANYQQNGYPYPVMGQPGLGPPQPLPPLPPQPQPQPPQSVEATAIYSD